jgi:hypothetical protein
VHAVREVHDPSLFDHSGSSVDSLSLSESPKVKFAVIANPLKRCGVHLTAVQQARVLNCPLADRTTASGEFRFRLCSLASKLSLAASKLGR